VVDARGGDPVISLRIALALVLLGALVAMLGAAFLELTGEQRLQVCALIFVGVLLLLGMDPIARHGRDL
jgi:hypothetical protein